MKTVNRAHSALRAPGERANADLKNCRILRKIRSRPAHASLIVDAIQTVILNSLGQVGISSVTSIAECTFICERSSVHKAPKAQDFGGPFFPPP
jgi:hypothetical protein